MDFKSFKITAQALYNCTQKTIYGCEHECANCEENYLMGTLGEQLEFYGHVLKWIESYEKACAYHSSYNGGNNL